LVGREDSIFVFKKYIILLITNLSITNWGVPSAVVPQEFNYVLHYLHPDFSKIKLLEVTEYVPDPRIDDILKKYRDK